MECIDGQKERNPALSRFPCLSPSAGSVEPEGDEAMLTNASLEEEDSEPDLQHSPSSRTPTLTGGGARTPSSSPPPTARSTPSPDPPPLAMASSRSAVAARSNPFSVRNARTSLTCRSAMAAAAIQMRRGVPARERQLMRAATWQEQEETGTSRQLHALRDGSDSLPRCDRRHRAADAKIIPTTESTTGESERCRQQEEARSMMEVGPAAAPPAAGYASGEDDDISHYSLNIK